MKPTKTPQQKLRKKASKPSMLAGLVPAFAVSFLAGPIWLTLILLALIGLWVLAAIGKGRIAFAAAIILGAMIVAGSVLMHRDRAKPAPAKSTPERSSDVEVIRGIYKFISTPREKAEITIIESEKTDPIGNDRLAIADELKIEVTGLGEVNDVSKIYVAGRRGEFQASVIKHSFEKGRYAATLKFPGLVYGVYKLVVQRSNSPHDDVVKPNVAFEDREGIRKLAERIPKDKALGSVTLDGTLDREGQTYLEVAPNTEVVSVAEASEAPMAGWARVALGEIGYDSKLTFRLNHTVVEISLIDGQTKALFGPEQLTLAGGFTSKIKTGYLRSDLGRSWYILIEEKQLVLGCMETEGRNTPVGRWNLPKDIRSNKKLEGPGLSVEFTDVRGFVSTLSTSTIPATWYDKVQE